MWLLILVLVFNPPNWPQEHPRPMREISFEYASEAECLADMRELARDGEDPFEGIETLDNWDVLLQSCEPSEGEDALIA